MRSHQNKSPCSISNGYPRGEKRRKGELQRDRSQQILTHQFFSISPMHQYNEEHLALMKKAAVEEAKSKELDFSENHLTGDIKTVVSTSDPSMVVGKIREASISDVDQAVNEAKKAFDECQRPKRPWIERSAILIKVAAELLRRRCELSGVIVKEAGKTVLEALADIDEPLIFFTFTQEKLDSTCKKIQKLTLVGSGGCYSVELPIGYSLWNDFIGTRCRKHRSS